MLNRLCVDIFTACEACFVRESLEQETCCVCTDCVLIFALVQKQSILEIP